MSIVVVNRLPAGCYNFPIAQIKAPDGRYVYCSRCGSLNLRYSENTRFADAVMWPLHKHALHCRGCGLRFHEHTDEKANWIWTSKE